jgi:hypothetical protein
VKRVVLADFLLEKRREKKRREEKRSEEKRREPGCAC